MQLIQNDVIQWDVKKRVMYTTIVFTLGLACKFLFFSAMSSLEGHFHNAVLTCSCRPLKKSK